MNTMAIVKALVSLGCIEPAEIPSTSGFSGIVVGSQPFYFQGQQSEEERAMAVAVAAVEDAQKKVDNLKKIISCNKLKDQLIDAVKKEK
jgi:hypothetical protein